MSNTYRNFDHMQWYPISSRSVPNFFIIFHLNPLLLLKFSDRRRSFVSQLSRPIFQPRQFCVLTKSERERRSVSIPFTFPLYDEMCEQCSGTSARTKCESQGRHLSSIRAAACASSASLGLKQNTRKREVKKLTPTCTADAAWSLWQKSARQVPHTLTLLAAGPAREREREKESNNRKEQRAAHSFTANTTQPQEIYMPQSHLSCRLLRRT